MSMTSSTVHKKVRLLPMDEPVTQPTIEEVVYQSLGEASMCWSLTPAGVFDSDKAKAIGRRLLAAIEADKAQAVASAVPQANPAPKVKKADTPFIGRNGG